ncbi:MAG TPA: glutamate-1-semialdehyde 2,1-aminomutase [Thermoleophilaceae bacterium]|nr:glutamate-1-semialdehyde 2,1-aminomutase [Thermoleophilaceae bacterium]
MSGLYEEALEVMPGGVNSPVRSMAAIGRDPIFIERGEGAEIVDVDGNRYVDWVCSWGPLIAGHAHPDVVAAVQSAAARGTSYGAPTSRETDLAKQIVERMPSVQMVRLVNSGTEATMSALRVARAATGRDRIVKFAGHYHGHVDGLLAAAGSGLATAGIPASPGVTQAQAADTAIATWNDRASVEGVVDESVAALICEPLPANMGLVPADDGFLDFLREATERVGALLVLDEVISGFRCQLERPAADLVVMGKVIGGGLPLAAYGGREDLMRLVAPAGDVYQAGTLSGNPLATAAGLATLRLLDDDAYARLRATSERLATGLAALDERVSVVWRQGLLTPFFRGTAPRNYDQARACEIEAYAAFARGLLERGVYPPASQFEAWFPSLAHTDEHVEQAIEAAKAALSEL